MTPSSYLRDRGFAVRGEQPVGAVDYVGQAGVFRVRVRVPIGDYAARPELWVGFTAGGPLVERRSTVRYADPWPAVQDATILRRILSGV